MPRNDEFLITLVNANPIEEVFRSYVDIKKAGRNYVCNCPFHSEKSPSCTIFIDRDPHFYCFGCGAGGDVITFIMKIENLEFRDAVKFLAERAGLEVPGYSKRDSDASKRRTRIYEMNRFAANQFYLNLVHGENRAGLKYFADRKLTPQTIKKYGLGFAPDSWNFLTDKLRKQGFTDDEIVDAWLGKRSEKGKIYDIFRNRVMFPIVDTRGNIIGFGGRVLDDSKPKYLNSGETPVFDKGSNLFSLNFARNSDSKRLILCEGYMDVIAVNQAGFENVVATLGTAITPNQARLISHHADEVVIAYDSDGAGQAATQKAINHFADVGLRTRILRMEGAKDPDEYIKKFGAARFRMLIEGSDDANNYMLDRCEDGLDLTTEAGKVELLKRTSKVLAGIDSVLEREVYISRTAQKCDIPVDVLKSHIDSLLRRNSRTQKKREWQNVRSRVAFARDEINPEAAKFKKEARAEESIICYLLRRPEDFAVIESDAPPEIFVTGFNRRVYEAVLGGVKAAERFTLSMLAEEFTPDEMGRISGIEVRNREFPISREAFLECAAVLKAHSDSALPEGDISDDQLRSLFDSKKN